MKSVGGIRLIRKNITKIYLLTFFSSLIFVGPIIVLFMQSRTLSYKEIMLLQSIFAIATVILEIPTGIIADKLGRKTTIVVASFIMVIAHITYMLSYSFYGFLAGEILFALSFALFSGSKEALLYDTLIELNITNQFKKINGRISAIAFYSAAVGSIIGGLLAKISLDFVFYANTASLIFAPLVAITLKEPKSDKCKEKSLNILKSGFKNIFLNGSNLKYIILFSAVVYAFNQSVFWLYQPYLKQSGVDLVYFGIIFASFNIVAAIGSKKAYEIEKKLGLMGSFLLITLLVSLSEVAMGLYFGVFGFIIIYAQQFVRGFKGVLISDIINAQTKSSNRATVLSLNNFASSILGSIALLLIGFATDIFSLQATLIGLGTLALITITTALFIIKCKNALG